MLWYVSTEAHLHEDSQSLMQAVAAKDRGCFERAVHMMKGRCSRVGHFVKTEIRENPARYLAEKRERIAGKVHEMESRCEKPIATCICLNSACLSGLYFVFSSDGVPRCCVQGRRQA